MTMIVYCNTRSAFSNFMLESSFTFKTLPDLGSDNERNTSHHLNVANGSNNLTSYLVFDGICMLLVHCSYHWANFTRFNPFVVLLNANVNMQNRQKLNLIMDLNDKIKTGINSL